MPTARNANESASRGQPCAGTCAFAQASISDGKLADDGFRAGLTAEQAGDHKGAIRHYRVALTHANAPRIRLELALSLLRAGEYAESKQLFDQVYNDPATPLAVKRNMRPFMEEAELRLLRIRMGVRLTSDSNPDKVSEGVTIYFNGAPLTYQPAQTKETAYGLEPWLTVEKLWDSGHMTSLNLSARLFKDEDLNSGSFGVTAGRRFDQLGGIYIQARVDGEIEQENSYALPSIDVWKRTRLNENVQIGLGAQLGYLVAENHDLNGGYYRPYIFGDLNISPNAIAFGRVSIEHLNSRNDYYTYSKPQLSVGLDFQHADWNITPQFSISYKTFDEFDPFWGKTRRDTTYRPSISFSHEQIEFRGMKPEFSLFYERTESNIEINSYNQLGGFVNIGRAY